MRCSVTFTSTTTNHSQTNKTIRTFETRHAAPSGGGAMTVVKRFLATK